MRRDGRDELAGALFVKPLELDDCVLPDFRDVGFRDGLLVDGRGTERGTEAFADGLTGREAVALGCLDVDDFVERWVFLMDFEDCAVDVGVFAVDVGVFVFGSLDADFDLLGVGRLDDDAGVLGSPPLDLRERPMATLPSRKRSKKPGDSVGGGALGTGWYGARDFHSMALTCPSWVASNSSSTSNPFSSCSCSSLSLVAITRSP